MVGQRVDGRIGQVDAFDKRFREYSKADGPPCYDYDALPDGYAIATHVTRHAAAAGGDVTLVWGLAEEDVASVSALRSGDGSRRATVPSRRGAYVMAYPGLSMADTITVTATREDGSVKTETFGTTGPTPDELARTPPRH